MSDVTSKTYEMLWDCGFCGTAKLLGKTHRHCPGCGASQDPESRYFPPEEEKVAVEDHEYVGADLVCANCQTACSAKAKFCVGCGAPIGDDDAAAKLVADGQPSSGDAPGKSSRIPSSSGSRRGLWIGIAVAVVLVVAVVIVALTWTRSVILMVSDHAWKRTIAIEQFRAVGDGEWCISVGQGAYKIRRSRKQKSTKKVADGETCTTKNIDNGDGTFRQEKRCETKYREEPIYADWCDYTIDRWVAHRSVDAMGKDLTARLRWPESKVTPCNRLGCQREGKRTEAYTVHFLDASPDGDAQSCDFDEKRWRSFSADSEWQGEIRVLTGGVDCDSLRRGGRR